jgi:hypothetical protein
MTGVKRSMMSAAGNAGAATYVEDVFSTYLYVGNGTSQTITNGIDLDGEGGLVWTKRRDGATSHWLSDTEQGSGEFLVSDTNAAATTYAQYITAFNDAGYDLGSGSTTNGSLLDYVGWTFRKAPGFFDVVTYTGDGATGREIPHNLGSAPGVVIGKNLDAVGNWYVYHKDQTTGYVTYLDLSNAEGSIAAYGTQTADNIVIGSDAAYINNNTTNYVAYLFADDDQSFGAGGDESIINCGSYTGNGSDDGPEIDLGWEPQYVIIKKCYGWW